MPSYSFRCENCHERFALNLKLQQLQDELSKQTCPHCNSNKLTQVLTKDIGQLKHGRTKSIDSPPCMSGGGCTPNRCGQS
ncbi:MAG: hypothetical protein ISR65_07190 [Bacteriovoracaceae bacterium]|nr:hypothetical protein [Bacteriovoracaceae bacterium]